MIKSRYLLSLLTVFAIYSCQKPNENLSEKNNDSLSAEDQKIEQKIDSILAEMTLIEKIGQTNQRGKSSRVKEIPEKLSTAIKEGRVGSLLNITVEADVKELQRLAIEESRLKIPLIFGRDVIHGHKTIFPIPLGQAATWNPEIIKLGSRIAAQEATSVGIKWTFAPMIDIAKDPRWGRIAESPGEDPYLASLYAKAYVEGFQGDDLSDPSSMVACAKHFIGYGAVEGGRDYNSAIIHDQLLHNDYLKPFKAAADAGVGTFMTSFNELNGIPASGNKYVLTDVLRNKWNYKGFVVSDWESVTEMIAHGYAADKKQAAELAANAGVDMEMTSTAYEDNLEALVKEGKVDEKHLDELVKNILRVKFKAGLFENPYFKKTTESYEPQNLEAAQKAAEESIVLLKNKNNVLPLKKGIRISAFGPLLNAPHDQLGTWTFDGDETHSVTPKAAFESLAKEEGFGKYQLFSELAYSRDKDASKVQQAVQKARQSDVIVYFAGEESILSGEAHSRANINLPGIQEEVITKLAATGKPIVLVLMAGRPITLGNILDKVDAVVMAWHPGTMAGPAIVNVLTGKVNPEGRLPVSWPKSVGQIPIHYNHKNTGRPAIPEEYVGIDDIPVKAWQSSLGNDSHYLDDGYAPLYPFGYGLTYTTFKYDQIKVDQNQIKEDQILTISAKVTNTGSIDAKETVQLYVQDLVGSITRPVRELKAFEKVNIKAGETVTVTFKLDPKDLKFFGVDKEWVLEKGKFNVWIAPHSGEGLQASFELI